VEGADEVKIFGETIAVKARIATINGFSGHAGQSELVEWFDSLAGSHPRMVIAHGEDKSRTALAKIINERYHLRPVLPAEGQTIELN
jgi:metallo-beta-lactamase family protein